MKVDAAGLAVLLARLSGVAEEVLAVLRRAASSPNIKERADCSSALFTPDGELLAQSESIPVHLGSMPASVRSVVEALGELAPGEQAVVNDPFAGGTHLNDVTVVAPVHVGGQLAGWVANRAHHADVGGAEPGSIPADATHVAEEGLRLPPIRLTPEVRAVFLAASRTPGERAGDLDAQVGANRLGAERLAAVVAEGWPLEEVLAYGERRMRAALSALPDGTWTASDVLDSVGEGLGPGTIRLRITVDGDGIDFDFDGTDPQSPGNVNAVRAVTESAVAFALRSATDPTIPANGGALRPVSVSAPDGSLVAASWPAAVGAGNVEVSQRVADVCLRALAEVAPDRVGAGSQGTMNNVLVGGAGWVYYETLAGGQGGRPGGVPGPGMSGVHTGMTNTRNTPVEALERAYPVRVRRYRLRRGSGGRGLAPGGEGIERDLEVLEDCTVSLITERRVSQPWGLVGGADGAPGENWVLRGGDEARAERLPDKCTVRLRAGDVLRVLTPGGGGWGGAPPSTVTDVPATSRGEVVVRDAVEDDVPAILDIFNEVVASSAAIWRDDPEPLEERVAWFRGKRADGWPVLVADAGGAVVGFAALGRFRAWPGYFVTAEHSIHVHAEHRGGGIGRRLLEALVERAAAMGKQVLIAGIDGGNDASRRFHERLGFREVAHLPGVGRKFGQPVDLVLLQRDLADRRGSIGADRAT